MAALLCAAVLCFFWPGVAHYDTISQYQQVVSGTFHDWHPPIMARLWSVAYHLGWSGQAPMFLLQILFYWTGLGTLAVALARHGSPKAGVAVLALGLWPPLLGWQAVVVKDGQMAGALLAAIGIVAWHRLSAKPLISGTALGPARCAMRSGQRAAGSPRRRWLRARCEHRHVAEYA